MTQRIDNIISKGSPGLADCCTHHQLLKTIPHLVQDPKVGMVQTRWEHLKWPPGETESPATGMPRPYGIMSLWDNEYFGHSLIEAAALIGKTPEELKEDPLQNIRWVTPEGGGGPNYSSM